MLDLDHPLNLELAQLQREIKLLARERDRVADELIGLNNSSITTKSQLSNEIKQLEKQKIGLLKQVQELGSLLPELKGYKKEVLEGIEGFGRAQESKLGGISSALTSQIRGFKKKLAVKDREFTEREGFLTDLADYYFQLASILSVEEVSNASKTADMDKRTMEMLSREEKSILDIKETNRRLATIRDEIAKGEKRVKRAEGLAAKIEGEFAREEKRLTMLLDEALLKEKMVEAEQRVLKKREGVVRQREIGASDQWRTIERTVESLKKNGKMI